MEEKKIKIMEIENYKNDILYSVIFGNIFLKFQNFFNKKFSKYIIYILGIALLSGVIFPISKNIVQILRLSLLCLFGIFLFFILLYIVNYLFSQIFKSLPKPKLIYFKNIDVLFYLILFISNIFYIWNTLKEAKLFKNLGFVYNQIDIAFYSVIAELCIIILFILVKAYFVTLNRTKNNMLEYYYKNHNNMTDHKKNEIFSLLIKITKEIRLILIILMAFILLKFILFYEFGIYQYRIDNLNKSKIELVLNDFFVEQM